MGNDNTKSPPPPCCKSLDHVESLISENGDGDIKYSITWKEEIKLIINLALPTIVIQMGATIPSFLTASYIGRNFGSLYLDGYMLANLTCNLCTLSLLQGLYSAADTLSPQAYGAQNYSELGLIAIRGMVASLLIIIPIVVLLILYLNSLLQYVGEDVEASEHASVWYSIYALSLPFYALYQVTWKFLSAQHVMTPLVVIVVFSCVIVLPCFLNILGPLMGFPGTCTAIFLYQVFQSMSLLAYLVWKKPYHPETCPKLLKASSWKQAMKWEPFCRFLTLGAGGMLASSEWIYWEFLSLIIGTLGVVELSVHTIPTQIIMVTFMPPLGIGIAMAVRIGNILPRSAQRARQLCFYGLTASTVMIAIVSWYTYVYREWLYRIFTNEAEVIAGCEQIWAKVTFYYFNLSVFGINMGIATALGKQCLLGMVTIVFLWVLGLPASWYFALYQGGGLDVAWQTIWPPYLAINITLVVLFFMTDWEDVAAKVRLREGLTKRPEELETLSLVEEHDSNNHNNSYTYGSTENLLQDHDHKS